MHSKPRLAELGADSTNSVAIWGDTFNVWPSSSETRNGYARWALSDDWKPTHVGLFAD